MIIFNFIITSVYLFTSSNLSPSYQDSLTQNTWTDSTSNMVYEKQLQKAQEQQELYNLNLTSEVQKNQLNNSRDFSGLSELELLKALSEEITKAPKEKQVDLKIYYLKLKSQNITQDKKIKYLVELDLHLNTIELWNYKEIHEIIESLILIDQTDKDNWNLILIALKNLTPKNIQCEWWNLQGEACYDTIIERLNKIKISTNIDQNKLLGTEILKIIAIDQNMTNREKNNYKAILTSLMYWEAQEIPIQ